MKADDLLVRIIYMALGYLLCFIVGESTHEVPVDDSRLQKQYDSLEVSYNDHILEYDSLKSLADSLASQSSTHEIQYIEVNQQTHEQEMVILSTPDTLTFLLLTAELDSLDL